MSLPTEEVTLSADPKDVRRAATIFKVLSHPDRLTIVCRLFGVHGITQKDLIEELGWPQSTMARHIGQLRDRGLIDATRHGTDVVSSSAPVIRKSWWTVSMQRSRIFLTDLAQRQRSPLTPPACRPIPWSISPVSTPGAGTATFSPSRSIS